MRLLSATVRNYRVLDEVSVDFADRLSLLTAPNESGKSTLVEALHRVLFLPHRSGGALLEAMRSDRGGHPEVELTFQAGDGEWVLRKVFQGAAGSVCKLARRAPAQSWSGDAAEAKLAELLGQAPIAGRATSSVLAGRWDHLWSWQGAGDRDPLAGDGQTDLMHALAAGRGDEAVLLSPDDRRVMTALRAELATLFTQRGEFKTGGDPALRQTELAAAQERQAALADELARHEQRLRDLTSARRAADAAAAELERREPELAALHQEIAEVRQQAAALAAASSRLDAARTAAEAMATAVARADAARRALVEAETAAARLAAAATADASAADRTRRSAESARIETEELRRAARRAALLAERSECLARRKEICRRRRVLEKERQQRQDLAAEVETARGALAAIPPLTERDLASLRQRQAALGEARAALAATATGLRLIDGDAEVRLDGRRIAPGDVIRLAAPARLEVPGASLEILPGGGEGLAARQAAVAEAEAALTKVLAAAALGSVEEGAARLDRRRQAEERLRILAQRLQDHRDPADELEALQTEDATSTARLENLVRELGAADPPGDEDPAGLRTAADAANAAAEAAADRATQEREAAGQAEVRATASAARTAAAAQTVAECQGRLAAAAESLGDPDTLAMRQRQLTEACAAAEQAAHAAATALAGRAPEILERKAVLAGRDLQTLRADRERSLAAAAILARELGGLDRDLATELEAASAEVDRRERAFATAALRARALRHLAELLETEAAALRGRLEAPFLKAAARYLGLLLGVPPRLGLAGEDADRRLEQVDRAAAGLGSFPFAALSHGAREQVAAALRLAMAETIAATRADRSLPLIFDESFAHSDPERLGSLGLMLSEACDRGLQVVLITCDDRIGQLGAERIVRIERRRGAPRTVAATPAPTPAGGRRDATDAADEADSADDGDTAGPATSADGGTGRRHVTAAGPDNADADAESLLALLPPGQEASSRILRARLGWDAARFQAARDRLESAGRIEQPPGTRGLRRCGGG